MKSQIAFCGLDCAQCPAYVATQANDVPAQEALLAQWRVQFNSPEMPFAAVVCDGCASTGRRGGYTGFCEVRACAVQHSVANCAHCPEYSCAKLDAFLAAIPTARATLEQIRRTARASAT